MATKKTTTRAPRTATLAQAVQDEFAPLRDMGFKSVSDVYDGVYDSTLASIGATRASIYCAIMGWTAPADSKFSKAKEQSVAVKRSSLNGIVNATGHMTQAERYKLAKESLGFPAMSHGDALARIREATVVTTTKDGVEKRTVTAKAVVAKVAERQAKKDADKEAKKAQKGQPQASKPDVTPPAEAMTRKARVSVQIAALMEELHGATFDPSANVGELSLLNNVLNQFCDAIVN